MSTEATNLIAPEPTVIGRTLAALDQPLSPDTIDDCIAEYESAQRLFDAAKQTLDAIKTNLILIVQQHGHIPEGASESKRLAGRHNVATVTKGKSTTIKPDAVDALHKYLNDRGVPNLFWLMFAEETSFKLVGSASEVLKGLKLPVRTHDKVEQLFGCCIDVKPKAPSLKVQVITPEKPARAKRGKAA